MKKTNKIIVELSSTVVAVTAALTLGGLFNQTQSNQVLANTTIASAATNSENLTVSAALKQFPTEQDFTNWLAYTGISSNDPAINDDAFIVKDTTVGGDGGWLTIPAGHNEGAVVKDSRSGATIDSYSRGDARGATIGQIRAALLARDK